MFTFVLYYNPNFLLMFKITKLTALFLLFFVSNSFSQEKTIDSLKTLLLNTKIHDTTRLGFISQILENTIVGDSISIHYNEIVNKIVTKNLKQKSLSTKEKNLYLYSLAYWYCDKSTELFSKKNAKLIINYYDKAIAIFKYLKKDEEYNTTLNNKGYALRKMNDYENAINCFFEVLKKSELNGDKLSVAASNTAIAVVYEDQKKFNQSLVYYKKGLSYYENLKKPLPQDLKEQAIVEHNIGNVYFNLGQYEISKSYFKKSLELKKTNGSQESISYGLLKLADIDYKQSKFEDAIKKYNEALSFAKKERSLANIYNGLANTYFEFKNFEKSEFYTNKAIQLGQSLKDFDILEPNYKQSYLINKKNKNFKASLEMLELYNKVKDSNNTESSRNLIEQQQLKYDFEKKELNYKLETQQKTASKQFTCSAFIRFIAFTAWWIFLLPKQQTKTIYCGFREKSNQTKIVDYPNEPSFYF
jgi:tetratricopeptide (TPR) repeat protein